MAELDLVREELREMARRVIQRAGNPPEPFGVYLIAADDPDSELGRSVERAVFGQWFGNSPELLEAEYSTYDPATYFICVLDHVRSLPAGAIRITVPSARGLKTFADIERVWKQSVPEVLERSGLDWGADDVWDVVTMTVHDDYRGKATDGMISLALYQAVVRSLRSGGARRFVAVLDLHVVKLMQDLTTEPFHEFAGVQPMSYLDSPLSAPFYCDFDEYEPRLAAADPGMHGILFLGVGIESVVREPRSFEIPRGIVARISLGAQR
jgi:hypothetical protein